LLLRRSPIAELFSPFGFKKNPAHEKSCALATKIAYRPREREMKGIAKLGMTVVAITLAPSLAHAHPCLGVCHPDSLRAGFDHPFGGLDHLLVMFGVGLWAAQLGDRAVWAMPLAFMSAMMGGGMLGVIGTPLPFVELGILGSLIVIGVAVAVAWRIHLAAGIGLVAAFALFHGYAHGSEMPESIAGLGYGLGFFAATALLHAAGVATGLALPHFRRQALTQGMGAAISAAGVVLMLW
jgi:urease accessory protein